MGCESIRSAVSTVEKYDRLAEGFAEREYADPSGYAARRAALVVGLGPRLTPGDTVLDFCCADGIMAAPLRARRLRYLGVDASEKMLQAARRREPDATFVQGEMDRYVPEEPVDATIWLRSVHLAGDRRAFFRRVRSFTKTKFVFDFGPSTFSEAALAADLRAAGFSRVQMQPFLTPAKHRVPAAVRPVIAAVEHTGPLGMLAARHVGRVFACATP